MQIKFLIATISFPSTGKLLSRIIACNNLRKHIALSKELVSQKYMTAKYLLIKFF